MRSATERKKRWIDWTAFLIVGIALPILYVLSIGPACWLVTKKIIPLRFVETAYQPVVRAVVSSPPSIQQAMRSYCDPTPVTHDLRSGPNLLVYVVDGGPFQEMTIRIENAKRRPSMP